MSESNRLKDSDVTDPDFSMSRIDAQDETMSRVPKVEEESSDESKQSHAKEEVEIHGILIDKMYPKEESKQDEMEPRMLVPPVDQSQYSDIGVEQGQTASTFSGFSHSYGAVSQDSKSQQKIDWVPRKRREPKIREGVFVRVKSYSFEEALKNWSKRSLPNSAQDKTGDAIFGKNRNKKTEKGADKGTKKGNKSKLSRNNHGIRTSDLIPLIQDYLNKGSHGINDMNSSPDIENFVSDLGDTLHDHIAQIPTEKSLCRPRYGAKSIRQINMEHDEALRNSC